MTAAKNILSAGLATSGLSTWKHNGSNQGKASSQSPLFLTCLLLKKTVWEIVPFRMAFVPYPKALRRLEAMENGDASTDSVLESSELRVHGQSGNSAMALPHANVVQMRTQLNTCFNALSSHKSAVFPTSPATTSQRRLWNSGKMTSRDTKSSSVPGVFDNHVQFKSMFVMSAWFSINNCIQLLFKVERTSFFSVIN